MEGLEEEEEGGGRRPQRRAARNLAKNVYTMEASEEMEFVESPASSTKEMPVETGRSRGGRKGGRKGRKRGGVSALVKEKRKGSGMTAGERGKGGGGGGKRGSAGDLRVPPMKIKLIGRTGESDSPIFFAESLGEVSTCTCIIHVYVHVHVCTGLCIIHVYVHVCTGLCIIHVYVHVCTGVCILYMHTCTCLYDVGVQCVYVCICLFTDFPSFEYSAVGG